MLIRLDAPIPAAVPGRPISQRQIQNWVVGQLLTAQVLSVSASGQSRIQIGQNTFAAHSDFSLKTGTTINLRVAEKHPQVVLQTVELPEEAALTAARKGLTRSLPNSGTSQNTTRFLNDLDAIARFAPRPPSLGTGISANTAPQSAEATTSKTTTTGTASTKSTNTGTTAEPKVMHEPGRRTFPDMETQPVLPAVRNVIRQCLAELPDARKLLAPQTLRAVVTQAATPVEARLLSSANSHSSRPPQLDLRGVFEVIQRALAATKTGAAALRVGEDATRVAPESSRPPSAPTKNPQFNPPETHLTSETASMLRSRSPTGGSGLEASLSAALERAKSLQFQNVLQGSVPGTPIVVEIPVRTPENIDLWRLEFDADQPKPEEERASARDTALTVNLTFSSGEEFRARLLEKNGELHLTLNAGGQRMLADIKKNLDVLSSSLEAQGIHVASIGIGTVQIREPDQLARGAALIDDHA